MKNILLEYYQSPGDTVVSTAAVISMMMSYHKEFNLYVKGVGADDVFKYCPYIKYNIPKIDLKIKMENPLINESHLPNHFLTSYCKTLSKAIEKEVKLKFYHPILQLSKEEREKKPFTNKYWIISLPGRKKDYTTKRWPIEYMQKVVNSFLGKITFIQTGESGHDHIPLSNVINKIGKTSLRDLINLTYHCEGVLTGESLCHHLAAAFRKPCVTIASGWLPRHWIDYPTSTILSKHGCLPCCREKSCWKARIVPLNDGNEKDKSLCKLPMFEFSEPIAKCMAMISPEEVISGINNYYHGGLLTF